MGTDVETFLWLAPVFAFSLVFHEIAHAITADRLGDHTARLLGRITLNPIKHLDPLGCLMFAVTYFGTGNAFGWANPVPVDPRNLRGRPQVSMAIVAIAGPITNVVIALGFALILVHYEIGHVEIARVVANAFLLNVLLAIFNMLPVPPLDGSRVVGAFMDRTTWLLWSNLDRYGMIALLVLVFVFPAQLQPLLTEGSAWLGNLVLQAAGGQALLWSDFLVPPDVTYLNTAYLGPPLACVRDAVVAGVERSARPWEVAAEDFFVPVDAARERFARLVGGDADGVAVIPAVASGITLAASIVPLPRGARVLVLEEQFPSNVYPWRMAAARAGAEVATVPRPASGTWAEAVLERLDETVAIAALPNAHWTDGSPVDLLAIGARCRELGTALVVDATQSLGAVPFDVAAVQPDVLVAAGYKWLLGPYGGAYAWIAPALREAAPIEHGWAVRKGAEDFASLVLYVDDYRPGARRFDAAERPFATLIQGSLAALDWILAQGVPAIRARLAELLDDLAERAEAAGLGVPPPDQRGHFTGLRLPADAPADLAARLADERIYASLRGTRLRVSPHLHATVDDNARLVDALERHLAHGHARA